MAMHSPIPSGVQQILDLFETDLPIVRFGDLEATVLASAAEEVTSLAVALAQAEGALEAARTMFLEKQEALVQKAHRALAYARVYAEGDAELSARVEAIALPRLPRRSPKSDAAGEMSSPILVELPRRRGRPRKTDSTNQLFDAAVSDAVAS